MRYWLVLYSPASTPVCHVLCVCRSLGGQIVMVESEQGSLYTYTNSIYYIEFLVWKTGESWTVRWQTVSLLSDCSLWINTALRLTRVRLCMALLQLPAPTRGPGPRADFNLPCSRLFCGRKPRFMFVSAASTLALPVGDIYVVMSLSLNQPTETALGRNGEVERWLASCCLVYCCHCELLVESSLFLARTSFIIRDKRQVGNARRLKRDSIWIGR